MPGAPAGDRRGLARRLSLLGIHRVANGEVTAGQVLMREALQMLTAQNDLLGAAESNTFLSLAALASGDLASAERHALSALAVQRDADDPYRLSASQGVLCLVMIEKGDLAEARIRDAECLKTVVSPLSGARWDAGWLWIAHAPGRGGERDRAAIRLLGAIEEWERHGTRLLEALRHRYQPVADRLRQRTTPPPPPARRPPRSWPRAPRCTPPNWPRRPSPPPTTHRRESPGGGQPASSASMTSVMCWP
jgi:hypothetical protein